MRRPSGDWPIPSVTISWAGRTSMRSPRYTMLPLLTRFRPEMVLSVVVFPAPFAPMIVTI